MKPSSAVCVIVYRVPLPRRIVWLDGVALSANEAVAGGAGAARGVPAVAK